MKIHATFALLKNTWKDATLWTSNIGEIVSHPSYTEIVGLGYDVLPLIVESMKTDGPDHWFSAIQQLTGVDWYSATGYDLDLSTALFIKVWDDTSNFMEMLNATLSDQWSKCKNSRCYLCVHMNMAPFDTYIRARQLLSGDHVIACSVWNMPIVINDAVNFVDILPFPEGLIPG